MINWNELKKYTWVVAVSGGADSFALLDMCYKHGVDIVCAHVNYGKRVESQKESDGVKAYCLARKIAFHVYVVEGSEYDHCGNFQAKARDIRYRFFYDVKKKYNAHGILVAHHLDDLIETYIMQTQRNSIPQYYGIQEETIIYQSVVKRILLSYTKEELEAYCQAQGIRYFIDISNLSNDYTRNQIRHTFVERLSKQEKEALIKEINNKNNCLMRQREEIVEILSKWQDEVKKEQICSVKEDLQVLLLRAWILQKTTIQEVHKKNLEQLLQMIHHKKGNWQHNINDTYFLCMEYGYFYIDNYLSKSFMYEYDKVTYAKTNYFELAKNGEVIEGLTLHDEDFPIIVRNAKEGDKIKLRMGTKKVSRFFIDNKISHKQRKIWPVVVNREGNVIFVHKIGCDIAHYSNKSTIFVLE